MIDQNKDALISFITAIAVVALVYLMVKTAVDMPVVAIDAVTKGCVRVEPPSAGDCDTLPEKYSINFVKEEP